MIDPGEPERPWQPDEGESQGRSPSATVTAIAAALALAFLLWLRFKVGFGYDPRYEYVRSADPVGFWVLIFIKGAGAATTIIIGLAILLTHWHS